MKKIDSHQHYWDYDPVKDAWIDNTMSIIKKSFYPKDVKPLMDQNGIDGCVAVQADQSEHETHYLLDFAERYSFIEGVVGWVDLRSENVEERLEYFAQYRKLKGFRHIVQSEPQDDFLLRPDFCRGISFLAKYNFTYDILIYPKHIKYALEFVKKFPDQKFIIDHLAKPYIRTGVIEPWKSDLARFSKFENVYCKIAGLVTEANWRNWKPDDFQPYIEAVYEIFGTNRVMFGSDWPVCLTSSDYKDTCDSIRKNTVFLSENEEEKLWGKNCIEFYSL